MKSPSLKKENVYLEEKKKLYLEKSKGSFKNFSSQQNLAKKYSVRTKIISGPKENQVLKEKKVTFKFRAFIFPKPAKKPYFEVKLEPQEKFWKKIFQSEITYQLDSKFKKFEFFVRACLDDFCDPYYQKVTFFLNTSPYFENLKIVQVWRWSQIPVIELEIRNLKEGQRLNVSKFKVKGKKFYKEIGKAKELWRYGGKEKEVLVENYQRVYLIGTSSPLGSSFRLNKCFGYLKNSFKFFPDFYFLCPKPKLKEISFLSPLCQEFILNLRNCEIPNWQNFREIAIDKKCVTYLNQHFNYNGCVKDHYLDDDFLKNTWYLYLGKFSLNQLHDQIQIFDENKNLVTEFFY